MDTGGIFKPTEQPSTAKTSLHKRRPRRRFIDRRKCLLMAAGATNPAREFLAFADVLLVANSRRHVEANMTEAPSGNRFVRKGRPSPPDLHASGDIWQGAETELQTII